MPKLSRTTLIIISTMLLIGVSLVSLSAIYVSSFLAILGTSIFFWGAVFLYTTPSKHVQLTLLNASANSAASNIERILTEYNLTEKAVYLPPKNLRNIESSLLFIPQTKIISFKPEFPANNLLSKNKDGIFLTPPGIALCQLFEKELGTFFAKTDLAQIQKILPKLLTKKMELTENAQVQIQNNTIIVELTGSILAQVCQETDNNPKAHKQVGCLLSSAIACSLAKATKKPITIQNEIYKQQIKTTRIEYRILEG